jgi:hypothetical protein
MRRHPCDTCGEQRRRWQRLCDPCFRTLPADLRTAIVHAWRRGDRPAWRTARKAALAWMGDQVARRMRAYGRIQARLGEREA